MYTFWSILTVIFITYGLVIADEPRTTYYYEDSPDDSTTHIPATTDSHEDSYDHSSDDTSNTHIDETTSNPENQDPDCIYCFKGLNTLNAIGSYLSFHKFRNINGTDNNLDDTDMGSIHSPTRRCVPAVYDDGYNSASGYGRYNPRELSNVLSQQNPDESEEWINDRFLTQFSWQFGQFIDHDITLITEDASTMDYSSKMDIYMPCADPIFDADGDCNAEHVMAMFRSRAYNNSGSSDSDIRKQRNDITSWIDASQIYGSDEHTADLLRQFENGLLKVTRSQNGDLLPTDDEGNFMAGDIRAAEVTGLTMMHTIFVRLHNIIAMNILNETADFLGSSSEITPLDLDELVYQYGKLIVNAIIQKIVYKDWLPVLFGPTAIAEFLGEYNGYDSSINGEICNIFSSAAFRFGHSMVPSKIPLRSTSCDNCCGVSDLELRDAFFDSKLWLEEDDLMELLINGYSCTLSNEVDLKISDGLRNFLFENVQDPLDLMSLNIQRGRDHGLPDYNSVRYLLNWPKMTYFSEMTTDEIMNYKMEILYKYDVNNVDLIIGLLGEPHLNDGSFGELTSQIVLQQFQRLRQSDRFWYENYIQNGELIDWINHISLKDIIIATTKLNQLQTLDDNMNLFQNTNAVPIFDVNNVKNEDTKTVINIYAGGDKTGSKIIYE